MTLTEAISILKIHQQWRLDYDIVMIEPKELAEAMDIIIELIDPKLLEGTTPNAWDMHFKRKLKIQLDKIEFISNMDDGEFWDGKLSGFEQGAQWVWDNFKLEIK
jgi:hypothetical protein